MAFKDLRQFIEALEKTGDAVRVRQEVDWDLEVGAIVRRVHETQSPAPFFERVKDYAGFRIFGSPVGTQRRLAIALGLAPDTPYSGLFAEFEKRLEHPIKPLVVRNGPCKENVIIGKDAELYHVPAPMLHDGDGGRYIGCCHFVIAKDPDSDWTNWGMYRLMIHDRYHMGGLVHPFSDMGQIFYGKYVPKKQPMPVAVAIGADPLCLVMGMTKIPTGLSEVDYAGGLRQEPVELVKCETSDILVPANAEIILEAELLPGVTRVEGPFGEFGGYRTSPRAPRPVYRLKAITHRRNPIFSMICNGVPVDDHWVMNMSTAIEMKQLLLHHRIPVTGIYIPPELAGMAVIVGVKAQYTNIATQVANLIFGALIGAWVIVVDEDVDVTDMRQVWHTMINRCHPVRGIRVRDTEVQVGLIPYLSREERLWGKGAKVLFDCTWPLDWSRETEIPPKVAFRGDVYPQAVVDKVLANWTAYGFQEPRQT